MNNEIFKMLEDSVLICVKGWISAPNAVEKFDIDDKLEILERNFSRI